MKTLFGGCLIGLLAAMGMFSLFLCTAPDALAQYSNHALGFDGTDDLVEVPYSADLNADQFTVSFWAKPAAESLTTTAVVSSRSGDYGGYAFYAGHDNTWHFAIGDGSDYTVVTGPTLEPDKWVHVAGIYDGHNARLYINGLLASTAPSAPSALSLNTAEPLRIGGQTVPFPTPAGPEAVNYFKGDLDELRIWNTSRTDMESEMSIPVLGSEEGLMAYYRFDQTAGTTLDDLSGGHHGTLIGNPTWIASAAPVPTHAGLWTGRIEINAVNEVGSQTDTETPTPVANPFDMRILLHADAAGVVRLLRHVTIMQKRYTVPENGNTLEKVARILITDDALLPNYEGVVRRDGKLVGIRLANLAFVFDSPGNTWLLEGGIGFGGVVSGNLTLGQKHPTNPFMHRYHPDHREGRDIIRQFSLHFDNKPADLEPGQGLYSLEGVYEETLWGLHKIPIRCSGAFTLERISVIDTLNDQ